MIFFDLNIDLRLVLSIALLGIIVFSTSVYGQTPSEFGYRFLPNKIVENTDAVLQVYAKEDSLSGSIDNLVAISSDSSIIQISKIEKDQNNAGTSIKIKALNPGSSTIALAAPGFNSQEVPITVYGDNNAPTKLLIKATPNTLSTIGSAKGYVAVELANDAGTPIRARQDTTITLSTTDSNVVNLENPEVNIKTGDYFAIGQFDVKKDGIVQISASTSSMASVSSTVTVTTTETPKTIQFYVFPKILNNYQNSYGYVIAQLQQGGIPVQATEDITLPVQITNASGIQAINTSGENPTITANHPVVIKKGSYWGYTQISVVAGRHGWLKEPWGSDEGLWSVGLTTKGYLIAPSVQVQTTPGPLLNDHTAVLDLLPILATGQKELIGVMHLENNSKSIPGPPVIANSNFQIEVDSSDPNAISVDKVIMNKGLGAALVFGKVGNTIPSQPTLNVITASPPGVSKTYKPQITVTSPNSLTLVADPLLPAILTDNDFPLALYMTKSGSLTYFPKDLNIFISPKDIFQTESKTLHQGESTVLLNSKSLKVGSSAITISAGDFATSLSMQSISSKPTMISMDFPDKVLSNLKNTFSIQLLDSQQNPVFLEDDTQFKLVPSDPTVLNVPENVVIKKGNYYTLFDAEALKTGKTELAVLTSDLPLAKFNVDVTSVLPTIGITSNDYVNPNTTFDAILIAQYNNAPLSGLKVDWNVKGAIIQGMESMTDKDGKAKVTLLSQDPNKIDIHATVSGGMFSTLSVDKQITVNPPLTNQNIPAQNTLNTNGFSIFGINPLFIVIPAGAAGACIILKKKNMLDGITQKINLLEKVSEIKERITTLREK